MLVNGIADAAALAMELAGAGRALGRASAPVLMTPQPAAGEPDAYVVAPGFRDSGEIARFRRTGERVSSVLFGSSTLLRLAPVDGGPDADGG